MKGAVVIGAGPIGSITAKRLAEAGVRTRLYDQKKVLGKPVRASGIISIKGADSLGVNYKKAQTNTLYGARIHANSEVMEVKSQKAVAYVLDRYVLNEICASEAVSAGAKLKLGKRIAASELAKMQKNNVIIGADGAASSIASIYRMGSIKNYVLTYRAEYETRVDDKHNVDLFFDKSISPGFFGWVAPESSDTIEIAIGIDSKQGNSKVAFDKFIKNPKIAEILYKAKLKNAYASIIPMGLRNKIADDTNGVLLVGDAAGQVKHSTGGGLVFGSAGARIAADAVLHYINENGKLSDYASSWKKQFGLNLKLHEMIKKTYSGLNSSHFARALRIMNKIGVAGFLSTYGDMDMPSLMLKRIITRKKRQ